MRNTLQYPITYAEVQGIFEELAESVSYEKTHLVGDVSHLVVQHLLDNFNQVWEDIYCGQEHYEGPAKRE